MGLTGPPLAWVKDYLEGRTFQVSIGGALSKPTPTGRGVPQGAVKSSILFNVLLSDLPKTRHTNIMIYADDLTIICRGDTLIEAQDKLQEAALTLDMWVEEWRLTISAPKSRVMCFTLKKVADQPIILMGRAAVPVV